MSVIHHLLYLRPHARNPQPSSVLIVVDSPADSGRSSPVLPEQNTELLMVTMAAAGRSRPIPTASNGRKSHPSTTEHEYGNFLDRIKAFFRRASRSMRNVSWGRNE
jgi:hypothetical protein